MLPPIAALPVMIAGAIRRTRMPCRLSAMRSGMSSPPCLVSGIQCLPSMMVRKLKKGETNLIDAIGGPGFVLIQQQRRTIPLPRHPSLVGITESVFLEP